MSDPRFRLAGTVLSTRDPDALASLYERMLGWVRFMHDADWVAIRPHDGGAALSFHADIEYVAPTWPSRPDAQQLMVHVDFVTDDRDTAVVHAIDCGATKHPVQHGSDDVVMVDPDGHPFCLILSSNW